MISALSAEEEPAEEEEGGVPAETGRNLSMRSAAAHLWDILTLWLGSLAVQHIGFDK